MILRLVQTEASSKESADIDLESKSVSYTDGTSVPEDTDTIYWTEQ